MIEYQKKIKVIAEVHMNRSEHTLIMSMCAWNNPYVYTVPAHGSINIVQISQTLL